MFQTFLASLKRRRLRGARDRELRSYEAEIAVLRQGLYLNLIQDALYADFPRLPTHLIKERRAFGLYEVKIVVDLVRGRSDVSVIVHRGDAFIGTLRIDTRSGEHHATLPERHVLREEMRELFAALIYINAADRISRRVAA